MVVQLAGLLWMGRALLLIYEGMWRLGVEGGGGTERGVGRGRERKREKQGGGGREHGGQGGGYRKRIRERGRQKSKGRDGMVGENDLQREEGEGVQEREEERWTEGALMCYIYIYIF